MKTPTIQSVIEDFKQWALYEEDPEKALTGKQARSVEKFWIEKINSILDSIPQREGFASKSEGEIIEFWRGYNQHCQEVASKIKEIKGLTN